MTDLLGLFVLLGFAAVCIVLVGTVALIRQMVRPPRQTYASALALKLPTNPADLGWSHVDEQVTYADRSTTPLWIIDGDGPQNVAVIVVHGFGQSRYAALLRAEVFKPQASKLVVFDLRAHGESTAATSGLGSIEVDDMIALIGQLNLPKRLILYGFSLGGSIAITAAARAPDDIRCRIEAVIAEAPFRLPLEPMLVLRRKRRYPAFPFLYLAWAYVAQRLHRYQPFDRVAHAADLACPLLILHGTEDPLCSIESARRIVDAAPQGELVAFKGRGHTDLLELNGRKYRAAIEKFLEQISV